MSKIRWHVTRTKSNLQLKGGKNAPTLFPSTNVPVHRAYRTHLLAFDSSVFSERLMKHSCSVLQTTPTPQVIKKCAPSRNNPKKLRHFQQQKKKKKEKFQLSFLRVLLVKVKFYDVFRNVMCLFNAKREATAFMNGPRERLSWPFLRLAETLSKWNCLNYFFGMPVLEKTFDDDDVIYLV